MHFVFNNYAVNSDYVICTAHTLITVSLLQITQLHILRCHSITIAHIQAISMKMSERWSNQITATSHNAYIEIMCDLDLLLEPQVNIAFQWILCVFVLNDLFFSFHYSHC